MADFYFSYLLYQPPRPLPPLAALSSMLRFVSNTNTTTITTAKGARRVPPFPLRKNLLKNGPETGSFKRKNTVFGKTICFLSAKVGLFLLICWQAVICQGSGGIPIAEFFSDSGFSSLLFGRPGNTKRMKFQKIAKGGRGSLTKSLY